MRSFQILCVFWWWGWHYWNHCHLKSILAPGELPWTSITCPCSIPVTMDHGFEACVNSRRKGPVLSLILKTGWPHMVLKSVGKYCCDWGLNSLSGNSTADVRHQRYRSLASWALSNPVRTSGCSLHHHQFLMALLLCELAFVLKNFPQTWIWSWWLLARKNSAIGIVLVADS